jgi:tetratricopeptide (TPR) repeat protein
MEMFMKNPVPALDPRRETVYRNFQRNLEDILRVGTGAGAKIVLSTVAVNLKDCPPFRTQGVESLPEADRAEYARRSTEGKEAAARGNPEPARRSFEAALKILPQAAEAHYQLAECLVALTNFPKAAEHFQRAADCDNLPFRADSRINEVIARTGRSFANRGVVICDAVESLAAAAPAKIAGKESFHEHVHLNFDGNYRLGLAWAAEVEKLLPEAVRSVGTTAWCPQERCERRLGLTDWNRLSTTEEVLRRLQGPPFTSQSGHPEKVQELEAGIAQLRARKAGADLPGVRAVYEAALLLAPGDHFLHENFAEFLEDTKDFVRAIAERQKVRDLTPHYYFSHLALGRVLGDQGRHEEALMSLEEALRLHRLSSEVRLELGRVYSRLSRWKPALKVLQEASALNAADPSVQLYLGEVLGKLGRRNEAVSAYREAIRLKPGYWEAHYRLGEQLGQQGSIEEAAREFGEVIKFNPGYVRAHLNLGVALAKMGRPGEALKSFDTALQLDPQNALALQFKQNAEAALRGGGR